MLHVILNEWLYPFIARIINIHGSGILVALCGYCARARARARVCVCVCVGGGGGGVYVCVFQQHSDHCNTPNIHRPEKSQIETKPCVWGLQPGCRHERKWSATWHSPALQFSHGPIRLSYSDVLRGVFSCAAAACVKLTTTGSVRSAPWRRKTGASLSTAPQWSSCRAWTRTVSVTWAS